VAAIVPLNGAVLLLVEKHWVRGWLVSISALYLGGSGIKLGEVDSL